MSFGQMRSKVNTTPTVKHGGGEMVIWVGLATRAPGRCEAVDLIMNSSINQNIPVHRGAIYEAAKAWTKLDCATMPSTSGKEPQTSFRKQLFKVSQQ